MPDLPDLDTRIRDLVARAVADSPAAPDLDDVDPPAGGLHAVGPPADRRRWWIGAGAVAVAAAAATVLTLVLVGNGPDTVTTPATEPSTSSLPSAPSTTLAAVPPTTVDDRATTTTDTTPLPATATTSVIVAGPNGVLRITGGTEERITAEPMARALDTGDGRVVVQRRDGWGTGAQPGEQWTDEDTWPQVVAADGGVTPLFPELDWGGAVRLHDIEVVGGRRLLLYSVSGPIVPQEANEDLFAIDLDGGEPVLVAEGVGGWEFGVQRLHLATTGLVVGESGSGVTTTIALYTIPGSAAAATGVPSDDGLGFENHDCADCPRAFTVTADGSLVAWIADAESTVYARRLVDGQFAGETFELAPAPTGGFIVDLDVGGSAAVVSYAAEFEDGPPPPVLIGWDGSTTVYDGTSATLTVGTPAPDTPAPSDPAPTDPPSTSVTTTTEPPGPDLSPVRLVAAGADGVAVLEGGVEVRRLDQPAEMALLTPGGAVIFQPTRATPDGTPGDPLIWRPDGTVEAFLSPPAEGQWLRLHDVASIEGVPVLLYGVRTDGPAPEDHTEVLTTLWMDPAGWRREQIDQVFTWEGGFSRLSLSNTGVIVGRTFGEASDSWYTNVVPGSPSDSQPMLELPDGVEESYYDCECPTGFTISADGESVVWTVGAELFVMDTTSREQRSWTVPALGTHVVQSLDARTSSDSGVEVGVSFGWPGQASVGAPVVIATSPVGEVVEIPVSGQVVTFGP